MKKNSTRLLVIGLISMSFGLKAQEEPKDAVIKKDLKEVNAEKAPAIFKFEPDYMTSVASERDQQKKNKEILDTLSISERKKKKLLKKMFKNDFSEHLSKTRVVETKFEDVDK